MEAKVCELINEIACLDELNTIIVVTHDVTAAATWPITLAHGTGRDGGGNFIPGARIQETYDLIERDMCWHPEITNSPKFLEFVREVKERFRPSKETANLWECARLSVCAIPVRAGKRCKLGHPLIHAGHHEETCSHFILASASATIASQHAKDPEAARWQHEPRMSPSSVTIGASHTFTENRRRRGLRHDLRASGRRLQARRDKLYQRHGRLAEAEGESKIYQDLRMKLFIDPEALKSNTRRARWLKKLMKRFRRQPELLSFETSPVKPGSSKGSNRGWR